MIECSKYKLSECCLSISDGDHLTPPKVDAGIPFITISDIDSSNRLNLDVKQFVPEEYYNNLKDIRKAQRNDILYSVVGSFGIPVIIKGNDKFAFQRHIAILRPDPTKVIPDYLFYIMKTYNFYMQADSVAIGAAQRTISLTALRNMTVELPSMDVQKKIATTLSRYDSLIDNYQKQIKLLEEAAQRLYKEWFVNLRFPGHESTKIVDGVPEGWEKKSITDILDIKYGKDHKSLKEGDIPVFGTGGIMRYVNKGLHSGETVLIPRKGSLNNIMLFNGTFWTIDTMFFTIPKEENVAKIAYHFLKRQDMYSYNIGAAVPSMTINILHSMKLLLPTMDIRQLFENSIGKFYCAIEKLFTQLRLLTESRDRLLPKLLSGEIEV